MGELKLTPLLEAAVAAREVGLDVPACRLCLGDKTRHGYREDAFGNPSVFDTGEPCHMCHATGINPDPARLGWAAYEWLLDRHAQLSTSEAGPGAAILTWVGSDALSVQYEARTTEGRTTALLRLVARVGAGGLVIPTKTPL